MSSGANPVLTDLIDFEETYAAPTTNFDSAAQDNLFDYKTDSKGCCTNKSQIFSNTGRVPLNKYSVVDINDPDIKTAQALLSDLKFSEPSEDFGMGAVMGLCIGDALGIHRVSIH